MKAEKSGLFLLGLSILICLNHCSGSNESNVINYFQTGDRIQSHPILDNDILYFGSNDNRFYAVDLKTGENKWSFLTNYDIKGSAVIKDDILYFSSGNSFYALNKDTGAKIWSYTNESAVVIEQLDPWDYHHGSPVINDTEVYFGHENGILYCFDAITGKPGHFYSTIDSAVIRCTPVINNNIIYFGDWNGRVYAYDLRTKDTLWTYKTYTEQPYPTFGQINTELCIHDSLLVFGARNPELQILNINTGTAEWKYEIEDGGWISGDPLIAGDTLFIGGSDCHRLFAFNVHTGEIYWTYDFLFNNFSKPLIRSNNIIFTTGDAYAYDGANYGKGYVYSLNKNDGTIVNFSLIGGNAFTNPIDYGKEIYIGCDDNNIYSIDFESFIADSVSLINRGYNSFGNIEIFPNPFQDSTIISFQVNYKTSIYAMVYDLNGNEIINIYSNPLAKGNFSFKWDGRDNLNNVVPKGFYIVEVNSGEFYKNLYIQRN